MIGQRPYWWVMESNVYSGEERPFLKQFKITCETGPGEIVKYWIEYMMYMYVKTRPKMMSLSFVGLYFG